ncbi:RNA polymerase subunit sigma-70 [Streptomyces sp. NPDC056169]|uniref:RNA polymerase subunit sigma-70 n=1 Tax=Streptomyces sp. NPDC056169 TaxID=3345734 RepID=UPI0035E0F66E
MTTDPDLQLALAGDAEAFRRLTEPYRRELQLHCYRITGSVSDAEDLVQETLLAAWLGLAGFEGRSSVRGWLYRIATNRSLNALRATSRRPRPAAVTTASALPEPTRFGEPVWLQPYPDHLLDDVLDAFPDRRPSPEARYELRESVGLAFVTALQHLTPRQRAAVVICDALGFSVAEAAGILGAGATAVKGMLQRGRAVLREHRAEPGRQPGTGSARERELAGLFATALEAGDTDAVVALLSEDAWLTMPPEPQQYHGRESIRAFLADREQARGVPLRAIPVRANGQPALGCYLPTPPAAIVRPYGLIVLTMDRDAITAITWFRDTSVYPAFGLPHSLPDDRPRKPTTGTTPS